MEDTICPLVTPTRYHARTSDDDTKRNNIFKNEHKLVTAVSRIDLSEPIDEQMIQNYGSVVRRVMKQMKKSRNETLNFIDFKMALGLCNVEVLESRAMSLYHVTALRKNNLMGEIDFEIALMINDSYPVHSSFVSIFELFSTFDVDNDGKLVFEQFKECINTLSYEERSDPKDSAFLAYLFKKNVQGEKMDFNTFVKLWCNKIADVKHVLGRRGLLKQKRSRDTLRKISGFFSSVWKFFQLKDILQQEMIKPGYNIITQFDEVRQRIVDLRIQLQRQKDKEKRASKVATRRQKRKGAISASKHKSEMSLILQNERAKTLLMVEENRAMREKIMKDCEDAELKIDLEYHKRKQEQLDLEALSIQRTLADRLSLHNQDLDEIPPILYSSQDSHFKLSDLKILDLSQNALMYLPSSGFFFHLTSLRKLCLSRNNLQAIPDEISCLSNLEILEVAENHLSSMPPDFNSLKYLQILDLSLNQIADFQEELCDLPKLKILKLHSNRITGLPSSIKGLTNLHAIDLSNNRVNRLPDNFCALNLLVQMNISSNTVSELPFHFGNLLKLEDLDVSYNCLRSLPKSMANLKCLSQINVKYNNLCEWGENMDGLNKLESFEGMHNQCAQVSKKIGSWTSLQRFSLPTNQVKSLPSEIGLLKVLVHLDIHNNQIEELPVQIGALSNLQYLDVSQNRLACFPHEFCLLKSLISLNSSQNKIESLPHHFGSLSRLRILNVSMNKLDRLPGSFERLIKLEELDLSFNEMDVLSKGFCESLKSLRIANLASNNIEHLPIQISSMNSLQVLSLRKNKLNSLPLEMMDSEIQIDITQNPLRDLPFKFHSTKQNDTVKENPSGYTSLEVFQWMKNEQQLHQPAVDEWNIKMDSYLSDQLSFNDFKNGVIWRCDNIYEGFDSNVFKEGGKMLKRLTQFYFHCKKYGNPPVYISQDDQEEDRRQNYATKLDRRRDQRMDIARKLDLQRREEEYQRYFGSLHKRCNEAEQRMQDRQETMQELKRDENTKLINDVSTRLVEKDKIDARKKLELERALEVEAETLNSISFKIHRNKKRYLPVEINPCWKSHHSIADNNSNISSSSIDRIDETK